MKILAFRFESQLLTLSSSKTFPKTRTISVFSADFPTVIRTQSRYPQALQERMMTPFDIIFSQMTSASSSSGSFAKIKLDCDGTNSSDKPSSSFSTRWRSAEMTSLISRQYSTSFVKAAIAANSPVRLTQNGSVTVSYFLIASLRAIT